MEIPDNAPFVCLSVNLLDQIFSERDLLLYRRNPGKAAMLLWICSGERFALNTGEGVEYLLLGLGLNFAEKRRVFEASEVGNGGENDSAELADVKSCTEEKGPVKVSTRMCLGFWHLQSYQFRLYSPPKEVWHEEAAEWGAQTPVLHPKVGVKEGQSIYLQRIITVRVLHMRRPGGAGAAAQFMADNPPQLIEANDNNRTKLQAWAKKKKWPNKGTEKRISKLMEDNIDTESTMPVSFVSITRSQAHHSSEPSSLKPPEPNAPS